MLKFFNIGKANAEIARLEAENASLKAAKPAGAEVAQLADAVSSNEQISLELEQANTSLAAAKQTNVTLSAQLQTAQEQVNSIGAAIKTACVTHRLDVAANATSVELVTLLSTGVATIASRKALEITAGAGAPAAAAAPADAKNPADKSASGLSRLVNAAKADLDRCGFVAKGK
jgi:chorismate synthase